MGLNKIPDRDGSRIIICCLSLVLIGLLSPRLLLADKINVAVASNFTTTLRQLVTAFEAQSGHQVLISNASTGKLFAQINHGAPFDIFLAADHERPERLENEQKSVAASRFTYALGRVVFWNPTASSEQEGQQLLTSGARLRLAIANPKTAPYGVAAQSILKRLGLWNSNQLKLVRGENVGQTFQFVSSGAVDGGFVALSQIKDKKPYQGAVWVVPQAFYPPIRQQAVLLKRAQDNPAAQAFMVFLKSGQARDIIQSSGYSLEEIER